MQEKTLIKARRRTRKLPQSTQRKFIKYIPGISVCSVNSVANIFFLDASAREMTAFLGVSQLNRTGHTVL
jgi:hypothetical protein